LKFPSGITLWQDTGFLGHNPKNVTVKMPAGKPEGKELSDAQKEANREISGFRILIEHAIGGIKKMSYCQRTFQMCRKFDFDDSVLFIACGLYNFRITVSLIFNHI
jgi:hypothetical protein